MIAVTLPYPPGLNHFLINNPKTHGRILSPEARAFKAQTPALVREQIGDLVPLACPVCLLMRFYRPMRSGDLSNRIKVAEDALTGLVYVDDKQVARLDVLKFDNDHLNPRVEIEVREMVEIASGYVFQAQMTMKKGDVLIAQAVRKVDDAVIAWYRREGVPHLLPRIILRDEWRTDEPLDYRERWRGTRFHAAFVAPEATEDEAKLFGWKGPKKAKPR